MLSEQSNRDVFSHENGCRPQQYYRDQFYRKIIALKPNQILDIGCGQGDLLQRLCRDGISAVGIDATQKAIDKVQSQGLQGVLAKAEDLPFKDNSFDLVVSEYSAHHMENLYKAVSEALRVSRKGVCFLDVWFDLSHTYGRLADRFDRWFKAIDQEVGDSHYPAYSTGDLAQVFIDAGEKQHIPLHLEIQTLFIPVPLDSNRCFDEMDKHLEKIIPSLEILTERKEIAELIQKEGLYGDGAQIIVVLKKSIQKSMTLV